LNLKLTAKHATRNMIDVRESVIAVMKWKEINIDKLKDGGHMPVSSEKIQRDKNNASSAKECAQMNYKIHMVKFLMTILRDP